MDGNRSIPESILTAARNVPVQELWGRLNLPGDPTRRRNIKSPWREEKAPSLQVGGERNIVFDHGSGESLDAIDLVRKVQKCDFPAAITFLTGWTPPANGSARPAPDARRPLDRFAALRGWRVEALAALGCREKDDRVTFPMRDATGAETGTRQRNADGKLIGDHKSHTSKGERLGLILPWPLPTDGPVLIVEGEADAAAALSAGASAVIATPGAAPPASCIEALQKLVTGRETIPFPDGDSAGERWLDRIGGALLAARCSVRFVAAEQDRDLDKRLRFAADKPAELSRLIAGALPYMKHAADGLPEIEIGPDEGRVVDESIAALTSDTMLYQRARQLVTVIAGTADDGIMRDGGAVIAPVALANLRTRLARAARFTVPERDGASHPPAWLPQAIHANMEWPGIRYLRAVVSFPVLLPDGSILATPGYHAKSGLLLTADAPRVTVPNSPTQEDVRSAAAMLLAVVEDFPFAGADHAAVWVASLMTPLARHAISGPAPLFAIDATTRGSGKSLLADCAALIVTGRPAARLPETGDDDECRKRLTAVLSAGDPIALIDNATHAVGNGPLDALLTSVSWRDRILGRSEMSAELPALTVWFLTGNNLIFAGDLVRRVAHCRLEPAEERPELRRDFKHPDLRAYVLSNRSALLAAALTILRGYCAAGRPDMDLAPWGSFEAWSNLIRSACAWAGIGDPGATRLQLAETHDRDAKALASLIEGILEVWPDGRGITAGEIIKAAERMGDPYPLLHEAVAEIAAERGGKLSARLLGYALNRFRGRVIGGRCLDLARGREQGRTNVWEVRSQG